MNRPELRPYTANDRQSFSDMMFDYFNNDMNESVHRERLAIVLARIEYELELYPMYLNILTIGGTPAGFVLYQRDTEDNPWGLRPGWGFLREIYILPKLRGQGLGTMVARETLKALSGMGADNIYLTADINAAAKFWRSIGFSDSGEDCDRNGLRIYTIGNL